MSSVKDPSAGVWYALDVELKAEAREAVEYALMEAGALGTETHDGISPSVSDVNSDEQSQLRVSAYFSHIPNRESVRDELAEALRIYNLPSSSVSEMNVREVPNKDWLGEWKKNWQAVETGRFVIAPPWDQSSFPDDRIVIRIEPGMAFGTGTHETTRLCLRAMERFYAGGSFLDVGTGTGILAIAAAKLFPGSHVEACDMDTQAIEIATDNARLNGVSEHIIFRAGTIDDSTASADFVCANLTAEVISDLLATLLAVTCGRLVLAGILDSQVDEIVARLRENGVSAPAEIMTDGEWSALVL